MSKDGSSQVRDHTEWAPWGKEGVSTPPKVPATPE